MGFREGKYLDNSGPTSLVFFFLCLLSLLLFYHLYIVFIDSIINKGWAVCTSSWLLGLVALKGGPFEGEANANIM